MDRSVFGVVQPRPFAVFAAAFVLLAAMATPLHAAEIDLVAGVLVYDTPVGIPFDSVLTVSLVGGFYTIDDPVDAGLTLHDAALDAGCTAFDSNTVRCPAAAITSFSVTMRDGNDTLVLTGVDVPTTLKGGRGNDTIFGGVEDDVFLWAPGDGSDLLDGGPGTDRLFFAGSNASERFTVTADGAGFDLVRDIGDVRMEVENTEVLDLLTAAGADQVTTTALRNTAQHLKGGLDQDADTLQIDADGACVTRENDTFEIEGRPPIVIVNFADVFVDDVFCEPNPCDAAVATEGCTVNGVRDQRCEGTSGADVIVGTKGDDVIVGRDGNDRIRAGLGNDLVCGERGDDVLIGGRGNDTLVGGPGRDQQRGDAGDDTVIGGTDADDLRGGSGTDDLDGGLGADRLRGDAGTDTLRGGSDADRLDGGSGIDTCSDLDQPAPFTRCELP